MRASVLALLAACSFQPSPLAVDAPPGADARAIDARMPGAPDAPAAPPLCDTSDASLELCLELDEPGLATATTALDGSGFHHDAAIANITLATRDVPIASQAVLASSSTTIRVAKSAAFDLQQFTLSAWIRRDTMPSQQEGVIDTGKQYTLSIDQNGYVVCAISAGGNTATLIDDVSSTVQGAWNLVACTYDGVRWCNYSFHGTAQPLVGCGNYNVTIDANPYGTAIAGWAFDASTTTHQLAGAVDSARIYGRSLSARELCTAAGLGGC